VKILAFSSFLIILGLVFARIYKDYSRENARKVKNIVWILMFIGLFVFVAEVS